MVFPVVLTLILLVVQAGLLFHTRNVVREAAAIAAEEAAIGGDGVFAGQAYLNQFDIADASVTVTIVDGVVTAEAKGSAPGLVPGVPSDIVAEATQAEERFLVESERTS